MVVSRTPQKSRLLLPFSPLSLGLISRLNFTLWWQCDHCSSSRHISIPGEEEGTLKYISQMSYSAFKAEYICTPKKLHISFLKSRTWPLPCRVLSKSGTERGPGLIGTSQEPTEHLVGKCCGLIPLCCFSSL